MWNTNIKWYQINERCQKLVVLVSTSLSNLPQGIGRGRVLRAIWSPWAGRQGSKDTLDCNFLSKISHIINGNSGNLNWREIWEIWILHRFALAVASGQNLTTCFMLADNWWMQWQQARGSRKDTLGGVAQAWDPRYRGRARRLEHLSLFLSCFMVL